MMFHEVGASAKCLSASKVTASAHLSQGLTSEPIALESIRGHTEPIHVSIGLNKLRLLALDVNSKLVWAQNVHWLRAIRLADDCHSCNIQLRRMPTSPGLLHLQTVRPINIGDELLLWFADDILTLLQMAFLTPANIQGQRNYVCTHCCALYEFPNPLKLHLVLDCGRRTLPWFWERMSQVLLDHCRSMTASNEFVFSLTSESPNPLDLSAVKKSAFTPFKKQATPSEETNCNFNDAILRYHLQLGHWSDNRGEDAPAANYLRDDSQLETIMSNLGKYKEGHVCMYCGKTYSRKYGLKIHIRTHTGYKPLKCKYCLRPFGDPSNLNKHVRLHTEGDTPYKCDLCGKMLVRRRDLERHLKSRHGRAESPDDGGSDKQVDDAYLSDDDAASSNLDVDDSNETSSMNVSQER